MLNRLFLALGLSALAPGALLAQSPDGPYWNTVPLPAGAGPAQGLGTLVVVETPGAVHFYSGIHRRWTVVPIQNANPTITFFNAFGVIQDGNNIHAYSSRTAAVSTIQVSANAQLAFGPTTSNWIAIAQDGTTLWGYSGFRGTWVPQTIQSSSVNIAATRLQGLVDDGVDIWGFGANNGVWVSTPSDGNATLLVGGAIGVANSPGMVRVFSPQKDTWTTMAFQGATNITMDSSGSMAFFQDGNTVLAASGYTGTLTTIPIADPNAVLTPGRELGLIQDGNDLIAFASGPARVDRITIDPTAILDINSEVVLVHEPAQARVHAFSAILGRFAPPLSGSFLNTGTNESVAFAQDGTRVHGYSPILGTWTAAQTASPNVTVVLTLRAGLVVEHAGGYEGFSSRSGQWIPKSSTSAGNNVHSTRYAIFAAIEDPAVHIFDARASKWTTQVTNGGPVVSLFRLTAIVYDATTAYGYSLFTGVWDQTPLQGTVVAGRANSSIGFLQTGSHLHTYTANGSLSMTSRYAEFSRFEIRGSKMRLLQAGEAGTQAVALFGTAGAEIPVGTLGTLFLDPASIVATLPMGQIGTSGAVDIDIPIPNDPLLNGASIHIQSVLSTPTRTWLSNSQVPILL